jgi:uncharacterized C2H2 Zn-finger protein
MVAMCQFCGKVYSSRQSKFKHVQRFHSNAKLAEKIKRMKEKHAAELKRSRIATGRRQESTNHNVVNNDIATNTNTAALSHLGEPLLKCNVSDCLAIPIFYAGIRSPGYKGQGFLGPIPEANIQVGHDRIGLSCVASCPEYFLPSCNAGFFQREKFELVVFLHTTKVIRATLE